MTLYIDPASKSPRSKYNVEDLKLIAFLTCVSVFAFFILAAVYVPSKYYTADIKVVDKDTEIYYNDGWRYTDYYITIEDGMQVFEASDKAYRSLHVGKEYTIIFAETFFGVCWIDSKVKEIK